MVERSPVVFLALDAADPGLVLEWCQAGRLPTFKALLESSVSGPVRTDPGLYTGSIWPSLATGVNPGRHGIYFCEQLKRGSYETAVTDGRDFQERPFWETLSGAGRRVAVLDYPKAPLAPDLNGIQVVDWATHDAEVPTCTWPPHFLSELRERAQGEALVRCDWIFRQPRPEETLLATLARRIERKTRLGVDLLKEGGWDFFALVFGESHCVGHQCWHVHDPNHPKHEPTLRSRLGDPIFEVYAQLDAALGELLAQLGPDTTAFVLLSHGMGPHYDATFLLDDALRRLENRRTSRHRRILRRARALWRTLPVAITESVGNLAGRFYRATDARDRRGRRFFAVPTNSNAGGIRINLKGREPQGRVAPGAEFEAVCRDIERGLLELVHLETREPVVKEVLRCRDHFRGEATDLLPDLLVRWHRERPIPGFRSERVGVVAGTDCETDRSGDHRPGGYFFVKGPGLDAGTTARPVAAEDFATTIAALLGVEIGPRDGVVIPEMYRALGEHP